MKNSSRLKSVLIIVLSMVVILTISNFVYAEDESPFIALEPTTSQENAQTDLLTNNDSSNASSTDSSSDLTSDSSSDITDGDFTIIKPENKTNTGSENTNIVNNNSTTNDLLSNKQNNTNVNRNVSNSNTLAKTGLSDTNGIVVFIVVLCGISAIYSYKKISDYKKI